MNAEYRYNIVLSDNDRSEEVFYSSEFEWQCETEMAQMRQDYKRRGYDVHRNADGFTAIFEDLDYVNVELVDSEEN